jgi:microcystin-dependent protein
VADPFIGQLVTLPYTFAPVDWALCNGQTLPVSQNQALFSLIYKTYGGDGVSDIGLPDLRGRTVIGSGPAFNTNYAVGATGGTPLQALTQANLPQHSHAAVVTPTSGAASVSATVTGTLNTPVTLSAGYNAVNAGGGSATPSTGTSLGIASPSTVKIYTSSAGTAVPIGTVTANGNVTGSLSVTASGSYPATWNGTVTVGNTGNGAPFSVMPPFVTLNVCIATQGIYPTRD